MKHGKSMARRILSALLVLVICFGMLPVTALADDGAARPRGKLMAVPRASEPDAERQPQDWVVPLGLWGEYDEVTVYRRISQQAKDFISCVQTMEGALNEVHKMLQCVSELTAKASNGTNADVDLDAYCREIVQLRTEITCVAEDTSFDGWHGLTGGSTWFRTAWEDESVGKLLYCETFDLREVSKALEALDGLIRGRDPSAADRVNAQIDRVSAQRSELGACQNMAEHIIKWADCCDENMVANYPRTELDVGSLTGLGEANHAFPDTEDERILTSTRNNALKAIAAVQLCEGALREIHDMFQRQNELAVQAANGTYTDSDVASIRTEVDRLNLGIRYILAATCIDGYHMMDRDGVLTVPVGWAELCHSKAEIKFTDFEDMLVDPDTIGETAVLDEIPCAIVAVLAQRSEFGAWQNGMEHVVSFCDYVLNNGPMVGNEFGKDENGSHVLEHIEGAFQSEVASILARQKELRVQIGNDTLTDFDRQSIQLELNRLDDVMDILVDLVYVRTAGVVQVQADGETDWHRDLVLDETGAYYNYKLHYASQHTDVTNVSVVDYLENGDNSVYAGVLTGIELPEDIDLGQMEVYVMLDEFDSMHNSPGHEHTTLPDGNWTKVEDLDAFKDWDRVYGVGVYFGDTVFGPELGEGRIGADVILHMKLSLGAKANSVVRAMPAGGYVLTNSVTTCENSADATGAVRTASEAYTTVTQPPTEENAVSVGSSVINQVWTDPDTVPTGPEDSPNWGWNYDAPVGSDLYYRTIINFNAMTGQGVLSELDGSSILKSRMVIQHDELASVGIPTRNLVLSCLLGRIEPDYDTLRVYKDGQELAAGKDYRLYTSGFHMYSDKHKPEDATGVSALMALRDRVQHTWCPYYTFGLIFSNNLVPDAGGDDTPVMRPVINVVKTNDGIKLDDRTGNLKLNYTVTVTNKSGYDIYGLMLTDVMDQPVLTKVDETDEGEPSVRMIFSNWKAKKTSDGTYVDVSPVIGGANDLTHVLQLLERSETFADGQTVTLTYTVEVENVNDEVAVHIVGLHNSATGGSWSKAPNTAQPSGAAEAPRKARNNASGSMSSSAVIGDGDVPDVTGSAAASVAVTADSGEPAVAGVGTSGSDLVQGRSGQITGLQAGENAAGGPQYGPDSIVITYKAKLDEDAFLVDDDGAGHSIEANGMPVRLVLQPNTATLGYSALEKADFEALIGGAGNDKLPRFAGSENINVADIEESMKFPDPENLTDADSDIRDTDVADDMAKYGEDDVISRDGTPSGRMVVQNNLMPGFSPNDSLIVRTASVYNYGFDIAKLDKENKLLQGAVFEVRTDPEDGSSAVEFVRVDWMDGSSRDDVFPEGPVYRLAVESDPAGARTTEIEAGKAIVVGLDSGTYHIVEKKAPAGHIRDYGPHSISIPSLSDFMESEMEQVNRVILAQAGQSMLAQANQSPQMELSLEDGQDRSGGSGLSSGYKIDYTADNAADRETIEKMRARISGLRNAWMNMMPVQVNGDGQYDLGHLGLSGKYVSAMALFDRDGDGVYTYGNTSLTLQVGAEQGQTIQGTRENPLIGGVPVVNEPGSEFELPKTGGTGTEAYIAIGSMMALLSGLLLVDRKKRR